MTANRVPQVGEVWVFRHFRNLQRGRVTIVEPTTPGTVRFRYHGSTSTPDGEKSSVAAFVRTYDFLAVDEKTAIDLHGPQRTGDDRLQDTAPHSLGPEVPA